MRGEDFATIDQPPNHRLFDYNSDSTKLTPLLRKRLEDAKAASAAQAPNTAPTINFSIEKELVDFLRPPAPLQVAAVSADSGPSCVRGPPSPMQLWHWLSHIASSQPKCRS